MRFLKGECFILQRLKAHASANRRCMFSNAEKPVMLGAEGGSESQPDLLHPFVFVNRAFSTIEPLPPVVIFFQKIIYRYAFRWQNLARTGRRPRRGLPYPTFQGSEKIAPSIMKPRPMDAATVPNLGNFRRNFSNHWKKSASTSSAGSNHWNVRVFGLLPKA